MIEYKTDATKGKYNIEVETDNYKYYRIIEELVRLFIDHKLDFIDMKGGTDDEPTVDATPIVHAHWIEKTEWYHGIGRIHCTCSNCGYTIDYKPDSRGDGRGGKFCDDCGAMMDEKPEAE